MDELSIAEVPHVTREERVEIETLTSGIYRVVARYGFMEQPDAVADLRLAFGVPTHRLLEVGGQNRTGMPGL